jgi:hypothetical protein
MHKIVEAEGLNELEDLVSDSMLMGYTPTGGVVRTGNGYIQAVYTEKKPKVTKKKVSSTKKIVKKLFPRSNKDKQ